ncbi:ocellar opsin-like isoform X2 [Argiope bruennichi]|uniref:ocellar opsin-like isoform X2 n=1 Tax=Argiope bruennichi TaxID=94029 RepID=UPI002494CEC3|nr:ocellar opsin-like isoform X2 [Argiope bruennichi]
MIEMTPRAEKFFLYDAILEPYEANASIVDLLPVDMLPLIHEHWYNFRPMKSIWHIILGVVIIILGIISICGNGVVLYLMASVRSLRTPANLLVMNLALSDFCMLAYMMPAMAPNSFGETWILGPLMCEIYGMIGSLFGCGSIWSMVMITIERYNVIVRGMQAQPLTRLKSVGLIFFVWLWSIGWTIAPFYGWSRYVPEGSMTSCTVDYLSRDAISLSYLMCYTVAVYAVPLAIMIYCYTFIVMEVATHEKKLRDQAKKMNITSLRANQDSNKTSAEFKLAKVAFMTVILWFMAWTPYLLLAMFGVFSDRKYLTPMTTVWGAVFAKASACYNPIVYGISHPKYKAALHQKFKCLGGKQDSSKGDAATVVSDMDRNPPA